MSEIKVRDLGEVDQKSSQEVEKELLEKHEQKLKEDEGGQKVETPSAKEEKKAEEPSKESKEATAEEQKFEIKEEDVLSHIKDRYGKEINSIDELFEKQDTSPELPEDVEAFFKYKKETGRGLDDFVKLNKDYDSMDDNALLSEYYSHVEEGLDSEDISDLIESKFSYDEDVDDDSDIKSKKLAKKRELNKARKFLNEQKESYKVPLESSKGPDSSKYEEELKAYREQMAKAKDIEAENKKKSDWFVEKTNELFSEDFKGFDFDIDGNKVTFKPAEASELKESNQSPFNFVKKYVGDDGLLSDPAGYHKALSVAMNPDKFAKFFYEQGQAAAIDSSNRKAKNIDMDVRRAPEVSSKGGMQVRSVDQDSGRGLKIRSRKKT